MLKVLYLTKFIIDRHGFARSFHLAKGLVRLGHQVDFVAANPSSQGCKEIRDGVRIITFPDISPSSVKKGGLSVIDVISRLYHFWHSDADIIMVDSGFRPVTGVVGHILAKHLEIPYVCEWWDWVGKNGMYDRKSRFYQYTLGQWDHYYELKDKKQADGIVALSRVLRQRAHSLGLREDQTCIIHGGCDIVDIDASRAPEVMQRWRMKMHLPEDAFVIGFAGMDAHEAEDIQPFLAAVKQLRDFYPKLYWLSTGGTLSDRWRQLYQVGDEYIELGWIDYDGYVEALLAANVLLLTQEKHLINEARWPNKLGDYLAAGKPVLTTEVGEVVHFSQEQRQHGLIFVDWESESMIRMLKSLIRDHSLCEQLGKANRLLAEGSASWAQRAVQLDCFLQQTLKYFAESKLEAS